MPRQGKRIQAVLFDFDDTLIDWSQRTKSWEELSQYGIGKIHDYLTARGHRLPGKKRCHQQYYELLKQSWDRANETLESVCFAAVLADTFLAFELDITRINFNEVMLVYEWGPIPGVKPYDDTIPVLDYLQQQGYKIGLITNAMLPMWMRDIELRHYQLIHYFDTRLTSGDVGFIKPHPAIYQQALAELDTTPEQAVFIGDRPANDIAGAINAGLVSIWMNPPHLALDLDGLKPNYTITKLSDLLPILDNLENFDGENGD